MAYPLFVAAHTRHCHRIASTCNSSRGAAIIVIQASSIDVLAKLHLRGRDERLAVKEWVGHAEAECYDNSAVRCRGRRRR